MQNFSKKQAIALCGLISLISFMKLTIINIAVHFMARNDFLSKEKFILLILYASIGGILVGLIFSIVSYLRIRKKSTNTAQLV